MGFTGELTKTAQYDSGKGTKAGNAIPAITEIPVGPIIKVPDNVKNSNLKSINYNPEGIAELPKLENQQKDKGGNIYGETADTAMNIANKAWTIMEIAVTSVKYIPEILGGLAQTLTDNWVQITVGMAAIGTGLYYSGGNIPLVTACVAAAFGCAAVPKITAESLAHGQKWMNLSLEYYKDGDKEKRQEAQKSFLLYMKGVIEVCLTVIGVQHTYRQMKVQQGDKLPDMKSSPTTRSTPAAQTPSPTTPTTGQPAWLPKDFHPDDIHQLQPKVKSRFTDIDIINDPTKPRIFSKAYQLMNDCFAHKGQKVKFVLHSADGTDIVTSVQLDKFKVSGNSYLRLKFDQSLDELDDTSGFLQDIRKMLHQYAIDNKYRDYIITGKNDKLIELYPSLKNASSFPNKLLKDLEFVDERWIQVASAQRDPKGTLSSVQEGKCTTTSS